MTGFWNGHHFTAVDQPKGDLNAGYSENCPIAESLTLWFIGGKLTGFQPSDIKALWEVGIFFGIFLPASSHKQMQLPLTHGNKLDVNKSVPLSFMSEARTLKLELTV